MKRRQNIILSVSLLCFLLLSGCADIFGVGDADILVVSSRLSAYGEALGTVMPAVRVASTLPGNLPAALETGAYAVEAFDTQAHGYLESGAAQSFYPHYIATIVIAVDRDRVADEITGWNDLESGAYPLAFPRYLYDRRSVLAMSVGLDGGTYDMTNALKLIARLNALGRIRLASAGASDATASAGLENAPVAIMLDYEAAALIQDGKNIQVIVPCEGTLSFMGGLLCDAALDLDRSALEALLLEAGFRLPDGRCDAAFYPPDYSSARLVEDPEAFNLALRNVSSRLRREGWGTYRWTTADGDEHALSFLAFFLVVIFWGGAVYMRTLHKGVRRSMLAIIALLILRVALRYVKTLFGEEIFIARSIWYSYYIPLLLLPVFCLWLAWVLDKPESEISPPRWWYGVLAAACALISLTLTNDLHQLVFTFHPDFTDWMRSHGFGPGYDLFLIFFVLCLLVCVVLLVRKAGRFGMIGLFPLGVIVLLGGAFLAADYAGVAFVRQLQTPFVSAVLLLLFFETALRTGFIPSNSRYGALFAAAPIDMTLFSRDETVFCATEYRAEEPHAEYRTNIRGGHAVLRTDLSAQQTLKKRLEAKRGELIVRSKLLAREQKLKDELLTLQIQNELYDEVEATICEKAGQIAEIVAAISEGAETSGVKEKLAGAAVLTSYVKCRSNLLLTGKALDNMKLSELSRLARDGAESALAAGVDCSIYAVQDAILPFDVGVLAYDLFEHYLECALCVAPCDMTVKLAADGAALKMTLLLSVPEGRCPEKAGFLPGSGLAEDLFKSGGSSKMTAEDETLVANVTLPFEKGGGADG